MTEYDVAIVGAGPAGVSAAVSLKDRGVRPLLIERAANVAASWRSRYDRLKLNTGRQFSIFQAGGTRAGHRRSRPAIRSLSTWIGMRTRTASTCGYTPASSASTRAHTAGG